MYQLCFSLAGLRLRICSREPVSVSEGFAPFLREDGKPGQDILLTVEQADRLPPAPPEAVLAGAVAYYEEKGRRAALHSDGCGTPPVCKILLEKACARVLYLPGYAHWVGGTVGLFNRVGLESLLLEQNTLLLHSAFLCHGGRGLLLAGPSGVGKSTQARLWEAALGARILNGDRAALRCADGVWRAWGLPYAGTSRIFCNESAPIGAVAVLRQAAENRIRRLGSREAFQYLFPELSLRRWDKRQVDRVLALCLQLCGSVPVYLLECLPDTEAVELLRKEICEE